MQMTQDEETDAIRQQVDDELPRPLGGFESFEQEEYWLAAVDNRFDELVHGATEGAVRDAAVAPLAERRDA